MGVFFSPVYRSGSRGRGRFRAGRVTVGLGRKRGSTDTFLLGGKGGGGGGTGAAGVSIAGPSGLMSDDMKGRKGCSERGTGTTWFSGSAASSAGDEKVHDPTEIALT